MSKGTKWLRGVYVLPCAKLSKGLTVSPAVGGSPSSERSGVAASDNKGSSVGRLRCHCRRDLTGNRGYLPPPLGEDPAGPDELLGRACVDNKAQPACRCQPDDENIHSYRNEMAKALIGGPRKTCYEGKLESNMIGRYVSQAKPGRHAARQPPRRLPRTAQTQTAPAVTDNVRCNVQPTLIPRLVASNVVPPA
eukprot:scaffold111391_cov37-Prasinocladus_malaysianus.AAC.1